MLILEIWDFFTMWKGGIFLLQQQLDGGGGGGGKQREGKQCPFVAQVVKSQELLDSESRFYIVSS